MEQMGQNLLMNMVIRPPRSAYPDDSHENDRVLTLKNGMKVVKKVFTITNPSGQKLSCSMYERAAEQRPAAQMPCVIYLHGNSGNKNEGTAYVELLQEACTNLLAFDFSGCGNSEGEWVTLGWKEKDDLASVISYLKELGTVSKIGLWGRSMGAATSIMYTAENNDKISCLILDSGFSSFQSIVNHLAQEQFGLPIQLVDMMMVGVGIQVAQKTGGMKLEDLKPIKHVPNCKVPALFIHGIDDDFVKMSHSEENYEAYGGEIKEVQYCDGEHNSERPQETLQYAVNFAKKHLLS